MNFMIQTVKQYQYFYKIILGVILSIFILGACVNIKEEASFFPEEAPNNASKTQTLDSLNVARITDTVNTPYYTILKRANGMLVSRYDPSLDWKLRIDNVMSSKMTQAFFDFESGENNKSKNSDIFLAVGCGSECENTLIGLNKEQKPSDWKVNEHGFDGCIQALQNDQNMANDISSIPGDYSCLKTREGNIVEMLIVDSFSLGEDSKVLFSYKLWKILSQ
jgi:hypothetical protein